MSKVASENMPGLKPYVLFLLTSTVNAALSDDCRTIQFQPGTNDKFLENHMIRSMKVHSKSMCESKCYQEPNCVSINYGPIDIDGPSCDLNNRTHLQVSGDDFVTKDGYIYRGILNPCQSKPCPSGFFCQVGFTTKGYRCVCPQGYIGVQCELLSSPTIMPVKAPSPIPSITSKSVFIIIIIIIYASTTIFISDIRPKRCIVYVTTSCNDVTFTNTANNTENITNNIDTIAIIIISGICPKPLSITVD
ncbi:uncharacterized protein LOC144658328 [Oculina patagonica]